MAARAKLAQKFDAVRTGGKGTTRRRKMVKHQANSADEKQLQAHLKRLGLNNIPGRGVSVGSGGILDDFLVFYSIPNLKALELFCIIIYLNSHVFSKTCIYKKWINVCRYYFFYISSFVSGTLWMILAREASFLPKSCYWKGLLVKLIGAIWPGENCVGLWRISGYFRHLASLKIQAPALRWGLEDASNL